jgi:gamma-tubulin complex component 6
LEPQNIRKNVYLRQQEAKIIQLPNLTPSSNEECTFLSGILDSYTTKRNKLQAVNLNPKCIKAAEVLQTCSFVSKKWQVTSKKAANWETLDEPEDTPIKAFSSESKASTLLRQLTPANINCSLEIKSISLAKLLNDIKLLMIGIESESFMCLPNDSLTFQMRSDITCGSMTNLNDTLSDFMEMGTCYKRLKTFTSKNICNQSFLFDGFIFKAFCDCIICFLNRYRDIIYSQEVETVLELLANAESMKKIVIHLTKFLRIHPQTVCSQVLPMGSDFLRMLHNEFTKIFNSDVKSFFVDLLKSCCEVYFINFQKWMFNGTLDDPHKELFIYFVDHYRPNTKYFFDKAYLIRKPSVPTFLQGCAENMLLCGKYTMLLKSHKPMVSFLYI